MMRLLLFFAVLSVTLFSLPAFATTSTNVKSISTDQVYAYQTASTQSNGAAFMRVHNPFDYPLVLNSASSDVVDHIEIHDMVMEGDVMKMRALDSLEIPPKSSITLGPGGKHFMLMGLKAPLVVDQTFTVTLHFSGVDFPVPVKVVAAGSGPVETSDHHMDHHSHP